jgi:DNA-binding PadR family transcriptional regulator
MRCWWKKARSTRLYRMEAKGWIEAEWGLSENKRRAKYYRLTPDGRRHFREQEKAWTAYSQAVAKLLGLRVAPIA